VQAFLDLKSRWMVPMHYGTFRLSHEPVDEPLQRLAQEARRRKMENRICVLEEGVTKLFE
jgi:L-ascorbate metabolism protein UlaG (beta-lactamase superfamily)